MDFNIFFRFLDEDFHLFHSLVLKLTTTWSNCSKEFLSLCKVMIYTHRTQKSNYSKFFLEHNLVLEPDTEVETIDQVLPMIMNGLGIGFLPEPFARNVINEKRYMRFQWLKRYRSGKSVWWRIIIFHQVLRQKLWRKCLCEIKKYKYVNNTYRLCK